jgi:hypothetical protein
MSNYNYSCIIYILNRTNSYLKCAPGLSNDWGSPHWLNSKAVSGGLKV